MKKKFICTVLSALITSAMPGLNSHAITENADMPKGWLLWHSYTSYSEKDSHLFLQNPNGNISEISGDFIHAMNGNFGNSPDKIVFMAIDEKADEWDIFLYDNEEITNLTQNSGYRNEDPKWSPDGTSIVFKRGYWNSDISDFTYNLALLDMNSMEVTMLTNDLYEEAMPCFSVDGKHIYYIKYNEGYGSIVCMNTDNGEIKTIFQEENINAYYPMTNDKYLYFTKWHSSENHHDEIMVYDGNTAESMIFNSEIYDCSDACPVDENSMIYSSTKNGNYSLYYFNGTESIEIPGINTDKNELGADFYLFSEETIKNNVSGDINADGVFNVSDIVSMQRWLLSVPDAEPASLETCDLTDDDLLNVFDLIAMKRKLIKSAGSVFI